MRQLAVRALVGLLAIAVGSGAVFALTSGSNGHSRPHARTVRAGARVAPIPARRVFTIGYSVQHRPIRAVLVGDRDAPRSMLVVGCIHGNEQAGIAIARRLAASAAVPGVALWVIPVLNPDGAAADTRQNHDRVDLNRNFAYRWRPLGVAGDQQYSGSRALSEPESRVAMRFILRVRPQISIWFHQPLGLVDLSGGSAALEREFARLVGMRVLRLLRYPGSVVGWENWRFPGTTAFVVELPPGPLPAGGVVRYARAVRLLARR